MPRPHPRTVARTHRPVLPATSRLHILIEWLRSGRPLTTALAADALGVSRRTITRDINHLRTSLCLAVRYDPVEGTYTLGDEHAALPFVPHPDLIPILLNGTGEPPPPSPDRIHLRLSAQAVRSFGAVSGINLPTSTEDGGGVDIFYTPPHPDDLIPWILSCGFGVEVLAPPDLRCRVQMEIRRMMEVYEDTRTSEA